MIVYVKFWEIIITENSPKFQKQKKPLLVRLLCLKYVFHEVFTAERPDSNLGDIDDTVPARPTRPTRRQSTQPSEAEAPKTRGGHQAVRALTGFKAAGRNRGHLAMLSPKFTTMYPTNQIQKVCPTSRM